MQPVLPKPELVQGITQVQQVQQGQIRSVSSSPMKPPQVAPKTMVPPQIPLKPQQQIITN